jgi:N-acetylmuramoyl-L-alanine amidase
MKKGRPRRGRPFFVAAVRFERSEATGNFDMLLNVLIPLQRFVKSVGKRCMCGGLQPLRILAGALFIAGCALAGAFSPWQTRLDAQAQSPNLSTAQTPAPPPPSSQVAAPSVSPTALPARAARPVGNIVVLDPAHGGTDPGARGTGGIRESEVVLEFAGQIRKALEAQGFQVLQTRDGNDNPSFDDRSTKANALSGAIFVTLHISSTGIAGTARVYLMSDMPADADATGLIPWDRAQAPFLTLSKKLGDLVQRELALRFRGSPAVAETAAVRQLRTTAAPAIAVEIASVSVDDRAELDHMAPGVADAIAHGVAAFRPLYVEATLPGTATGVHQ